MGNNYLQCSSDKSAMRPNFVSEITKGPFFSLIFKIKAYYSEDDKK